MQEKGSVCLLFPILHSKHALSFGPLNDEACLCHTASVNVHSLSKMLSGKRPQAAPPAPPPVVYSKPTIEVRNSFCTMYGFPEDAVSLIRELLTYENEDVQFEIAQCFRMIESAKRKQNRKMEWAFLKKLEELKAKRVVCWLKDGKFPTGHLDIVRNALGDLLSGFDVVDHRQVPTAHHILRWRVPPPEPRYYQREMIDVAKEHTRGVLEAAVGSGKSLVLAYLVKELSVTSLIIVPSSALFEQIGRGLEELFGKGVVTRLSTDKIKKGAKLAPIRLATIQTLASLNKQGLVGAALEDVGLVVVDEIHHAGSESYTKLLPHLDHVYYRIGLTGTFLRNDSKTLDMWGFLSNRLYYYPAQKAIEDGFLTPVNFTIESLPGKQSRDYQKEYTQNFCGKPELLEAILRRIDSIPKDEQILILVDRKEKAGKIIHEYLAEAGYDNTYISGDDKREKIANSIQAFNGKEIRILIGSTVIGEGVDVHSTQHLILATGGKSVVKIVQAIGRCVRLSPGKTTGRVYDFMFRDTNYLLKHTMKRVEIYEEQFAGQVSFEEVS
jgi:superfamily II DNA or RNA helicase